MSLVKTAPPAEWLEMNNVALRATHAQDIINGKEKGVLWNAVYLMYQGDCLEALTANRYRHQLSTPFYNAAQALIQIEALKATPDAKQEFIDYLQYHAMTNFLAGVGFRNNKRSRKYTDADLLLLYDYEEMLSEQELEDGTISKPRTKADMYLRVAKVLGVSDGHVKREILRLSKERG